jgi:DNA segregation ATPase FtsK/SpoIIIE-like protein
LNAWPRKSATPASTRRHRIRPRPLLKSKSPTAPTPSTSRKRSCPKIAGSYKLPPSSLLHRPDEQQAVHEDELKIVAQVLTAKYAEFEVLGQVTQINPGPVVTTFEFKPEAGIKYSRIISLTDDLCLALRAESILVERMPGKSTVGIQVPNREREIIWLRENIESPEFLGSKSKLTVAMGKDINGRIAAADLAGMPHLLIAGSTGTGKSVAINAMIMSILYKSTPEEVRLVLVDPKRLELGNYEGVPHLYTPIITEPKLAANALRNAVREMERRLKLLASKGVRNIDSYNRLFDDTPSLFSEQATADDGPIPKIVIIIDELADSDDAGRSQRGRIDNSPGADGPRRRHSLSAGHAATIGRCHHRPYQSELPRARLVPRRNQSRLAHHSRRERRRIASRTRRHALPAFGLGACASPACSVRNRKRNRSRSGILEGAGRGAISGEIP